MLLKNVPSDPIKQTCVLNHILTSLLIGLHI